MVVFIQALQFSLRFQIIPLKVCFICFHSLYLKILPDKVAVYWAKYPIIAQLSTISNTFRHVSEYRFDVRQRKYATRTTLKTNVCASRYSARGCKYWIYRSRNYRRLFLANCNFVTHYSLVKVRKRKIKITTKYLHCKT